MKLSFSLGDLSNEGIYQIVEVFDNRKIIMSRTIFLKDKKICYKDIYQKEGYYSALLVRNH